MHPYRNLRLTEAPDVGDIRQEGRRSAIGRCRKGDVITNYVDNNIVRYADGTPGRVVEKVVYNDERGYNKPHSKAVIRRNLKRADKAKAMKEIEFEVE